MFSESDSYIDSSGVILSRKLLGENTFFITLFLKGYGLIDATAYSRSRSGEKEPLIWGTFKLRKKSRSRKYIIEDAEIRDDMLDLRRRKDGISTALWWCSLLTKYLEPSQPDDDLLANLYWCMKLLDSPCVPIDASGFRFVWRWLDEWGLAPELEEFFGSKRFSGREIFMLTFISDAGFQEVIATFNSHTDIPADIFRRAVRHSVRLLAQK